MAVAVFPPGGPGVKYPAPNGITYIWDEDNQRWSVLSTKRNIKTIVIISDREPENVVSGDLWYDTTDSLLKVYVNDHWESSGEPDLERVLTSGNVADKDIYLTHLESGDADIIDISPEKAKVVIATERDKVPTFELQHYAVDDNSQVKLELDEDGTRFDIECDEKVNNIHFRFEEDDKFILNKEGDAVFSGDVHVNGQLDIENGMSVTGDAYMKFSPKDGDSQLLTLDSGSSYLPMLHLKSYVSSTTTTDGEEQPEVDTAARKDVFIVRANGEAELSGHLSLMPGTKDNEAVTYNQLLELEQEIEALVPSVERGQFEITLDTIENDNQYDGKFNMLRDFTQEDRDEANAVCMQEYSDCIFNDPEGTRPCQQELEACSNAIPAVGSKVTTDDFGSVKQLKFSIKDINGDNHGWTTVAVGQLIEVFNQDDDSYLIAEVTQTEGMWYELITFTVTPIKYKGSATGVCRIKIFEMDLSAGSDLDFVRIRGSNKVENNWKIESETKTHFHVKDGESRIYWLQDPDHDQHPTTRGFTNRTYLKKSGDTTTGWLQVTRPEATTSNYIFSVDAPHLPDGQSIAFRVTGDGKVKAGHDSSSPFIATQSNDVVTKKALDDALSDNGTKYFQIDKRNQTTDPIWIRPKNADGDIKGNAGIGNMLVVNQESGNQGSIVRIQQNGTDCLKVEVDQAVNLFGNRVYKLADPIPGDDGAQDAVNRRYLENYVAANVRRLWKWTGDQTSTPGEGKFSWAQSGAGYCYFDHRPFIGSELYCSGNKYFCKGGDSQAPDKEMGYAFMTLWEWTGSRWEPVFSGHLSASGVRTGKNNEPWRFSVDKNSILKLKDMTTDGLYSICVAGTILA